MDTKSGLDKVGSALGLAALSPLFATVSIVNTVYFKDNPFYKVERLGKDGKLFDMIKFRSMHEKKDDNGNNLPDEERTTPWGKFLRATSIDELPQLFNVLKGDMSLVGPRPHDPSELPEIVKSGTEDILSVRPGMTGIWQIAVIGNKESGLNDRNQLDAQYVRERSSLLNDLAIMVKTIPAFIKGHDGNYLTISLSKTDAEKETRNTLNSYETKLPSENMDL